MYCTEVKHLFWTLPLVAMPVRIFQKLTAKEVFFPVLSSPVLVVIEHLCFALESNTLGDVLQLVQLF